MDHFAGLDVSVKDTNVCIVDDTGRITREVKVERLTLTGRLEKRTSSLTTVAVYCPHAAGGGDPLSL